MTSIQKLDTIEYAGHYSVFDINGNKICDVGTLNDALMLCSFDETRTYRQVKIIMDQVVNIPYIKLEGPRQLNSQNILPDRQAIPVVV